MIAPEKVPRKLASKEIAHGMSTGELTLPLFVPFALVVFFGVTKFHAIVTTIFLYLFLFIARNVLEKNYVVNKLSRKKVIYTEKIRTRNDN